jgi:YHS domain-containing protein
MTRSIVAGLLVLSFAIPAARPADEDNPTKEALQALNEYIGSWKGAGSNTSKTESWAEKFSWGWRFKGDDTWLMVEFKDGKEFNKGEIRFLADKKKYQLTAFDKKDNKQVFEGELKKGYLTLDRVDSKSGDTFRLTMNVAGDGVRFVYSMQRKAKGTTVFSKLYQVDFSKEGVSLAGGGKEKECVVTGGKGTIEVSYMGRTYYVCCSGCRDAFNENPAKIIKEAEERKKKEK